MTENVSQQTIGVLITNLGTPAAPTKKALRAYLKQFLSDPRVVEIPKLVWWPILNGIILNTRPAKSAKLYASIWGEQGSPLLAYTKDQCDALQSHFNHTQPQVKLAYAMRYGQPSIAAALEKFAAQGVEKILVFPLYPQYAAATAGSTFDAVAQHFNKTRRIPALRFIDHYHDNPNYIAACAHQIQQHWQQHGRNEKLILSYHGLPKATIEKGDPYYHQCLATTHHIVNTLDIKEDQYLHTFQSRFGKAEWLQPYTDKSLEQLGSQGIASVDVFCPGFSADCLETLEEIEGENKEVFLSAGGKHYSYIPALNASTAHIEALAGIISNSIAGWVSS